MVYNKKQNLIFLNDKNNEDTINILLHYPKGFEPNFDYWWKKKIYKTDTLSTKRSFQKTFKTYSNLKMQNQANTLSSNFEVKYIKTEKDNGLKLEISPFEEVYILNEFSESDTLIFKQKSKNINCVNNCIKSLEYLRNIGIIRIQKENGENWNLKKTFR